MAELTDDQKKILISSWNTLKTFFYIFLVLKLTGLIDWSWWWITVPLWGVFALIIGFILLIIVLYIIYYSLRTIYLPIIEKIQEKREEKMGLEIVNDYE